MQQKTRIIRLLVGLIFLSSLAIAQTEATIIESPIHLNRDGLDLKGKECLILVPENRNNTNSRKIAVHFYWFPAENTSKRPPVFYLPGGPGGSISGRHLYKFFGGKKAEAFVQEVNAYRKERDLIILNQRGHSEAPGFQIHQFKFWQPNGKREQELNLEELYQETFELMQKSTSSFQELGIDTDGYTIIEMAKDIESIRAALNYEKVALVGTSFGSQWALAYLQLFPEKVDRALLSGIEPLDYAIDDPADVWKMYTRLDKIAENNTDLKRHLPKIGLTGAVKEIAHRLEKSPVKVHLQIPEENIDVHIPIEKDDFIANLQYPFADNRQEALRYWPKYISELYAGDYRNLALWAYEERKGYEFDLLMPNLVDNSIGISPEREKEIMQRPENAWMSNQNNFFKKLREAQLTPDVGNDFRQTKKIKAPVLMIHGNLDWSTPIENAHYLYPYLEQGHLLEIQGGTHDAKRELLLNNPQLAEEVLRFINLDWEEQSFQAYSDALPKSFSLEEIKFIPIGSKALFEQLIEEE